MEAAATCFSWSQPLAPQQQPLYQKLISGISSPSRKRTGNERVVVSRLLRQQDQLALFGRLRSKLPRTCSLDVQRSSSHDRPTIRRAISASLDDDSFFDEEFLKQIEELSRRFDDSDDEIDDESEERDAAEEIRSSEGDFTGVDSRFPSRPDFGAFEPAEPPWRGEVRLGPFTWPESGELIPANIEWKVNSVELPLSLRMLKKKKQWKEGFRDAGESAICSVKKAFSSMVFIIQELQRYTLRMREVLLYENLQGIFHRVQKEMHASFAWLFEQIFSQTPSLMVCLMILLANFTVYSMCNNVAIAATPLPSSFTATTETAVPAENDRVLKFDTLSIKPFSVTGRTASVGGAGGGGKVRPVTGATGGDGWLDKSSSLKHRVGASQAGDRLEKEEEGVFGPQLEEEVKLWDSIVEEASRMQARLRDPALDSETMQRLVSPVTAELEPDDYSEYFSAELTYQQAVSQEPENPLLLSNYAQFLFVVLHDHDRAEEYFKRAVQVKPADAEALSRYATFLWLAREDITAAEETYLEAIAADPSNTLHAGNYAHFLWNTGGEDTCYPLDGDNCVET